MDLSSPRNARTISQAKYRLGSIAVVAPCVVRELSAELLIDSTILSAKNIGTGASRIIEPFPADRTSVGPE